MAVDRLVGRGAVEEGVEGLFLDSVPGAVAELLGLDRLGVYIIWLSGFRPHVIYILSNFPGVFLCNVFGLHSSRLFSYGAHD